MKPFLFCCAAVLLTLFPEQVRASEAPASAPTAAPDATNPSGAAPTVAQPAPETPAAPAPAPATGKKADPALDLLPAQPGQILPEQTLTPDNPMESDIHPPPTAPAQPRVSKTETAEQDLALRIRCRQARTRALTDPAVQAEWNNATIARTDLERREALMRYYKLLYGRMLKSDSSIAKLVQIEKDLSTRRLQQSRIAPTEALDPNESSRRGYLAAPFTADQF